jgi:predicted permease
MTRRSVLPAPVRWLLHAVVPARTADTVLGDLEEEWIAMRTLRAPPSAYTWLAREALSLLAAYMTAPWRPLHLKGLGTMWTRDVRLVLRGMRRTPLATVAAVALLSSGLLAVAVSSGLASALLFRPVSDVHGDALRRIAAIDRRGAASYAFSFIELQALRERLAGTATLAAVNLQPVLVRAAGVDRQTTGEVVDGEYFGAIGTRMLLGRGLAAADDRHGSPRVAVVSESLWRDRFNASAEALGTPVLLNGASYAIVGVAGRSGASGLFGTSVDVWIPMAHADPMLGRHWRTDVTNRWFNVFMLPDTTLADAEGPLAATAADLARAYPDRWRDRRLQTAPGTFIPGRQRTLAQTLAAILGGLSALILAVAAANVGGLLLSRAAVNRHAAAIHLALGSGHAAIARRLTIEGSLVGLVGGLLALGLYFWVRLWFSHITLLPTLALRLDLPLDAQTTGVVIAAGLASGLFLASGPALWASRLDISGMLREAGRAGNGRGITRPRQMLVSGQVCFSLALIVSAALFVRSLNALNRVDLGFPRAGLVAMDFDVEPSEAAPADMPRLAREALARVAALPGVVAAAMSNRAPVDPSTPAVDVTAAPGRASVGDVSVYLATAAYFDTVGLSLTAGRSFTQAEAESNAKVAIVNEALASRLWPPGDALDRELHVPAEGVSFRVIGIARNSKYRSLSEAARPHLYRPTPAGLGLTLLARTRGNPHEALGSMQRVLDRVGPGLVGFFPRTLDDHLVIETLPSRVVATAATSVGTLALLLSTVGLYGLVAWFVELRRREIGVRMALGASAADVRWLVVRQALTTALPGMAAGLALAAALAVSGRSILFGVQPLDPFALAAGVAALGLVVASASYLPARRATRVDPALVLRQ